MPRRLERLLSPDYTASLDSLTIEELRAKKGECEEEEVAISYMRRVTQGRLDILVADLRRRAVGDGRTELRDLVDQLSTILADGPRSASSGGRLPALLAPEVDDDVMAQLDDVLPEGTLADLVNLDDAEAIAVGERLRDLERRLSAERRAIHDRLAILEQDLVRRYKANEVDVDSLLR